MGENQDGPDDALLLAGDAQDFGRFYALHEDYVLTLFLARGAPAELAADLAAETFARALVARRSFDAARGAPRGWLTGIARHVLADSFRRGRVEDTARRKLGLERLQIDDAAIARIDELAEDRALCALEALPEDQRVAVRGRVLEEADYTELASTLGCSPSVVRQRVSRGLRALRERLKESA
ncbi:MAG: polymerase, sigma-24 subunit, subfamily [Solirubrobacterales bacterium]|nr:polymerase, sigma-24 subunit, subfamily [Solirubrobacterales bacterium]